MKNAVKERHAVKLPRKPKKTDVGNCTGENLENKLCSYGEEGRLFLNQN